MVKVSGKHAWCHQICFPDTLTIVIWLLGGDCVRLGQSIEKRSSWELWGWFALLKTTLCKKGGTLPLSAFLVCFNVFLPSSIPSHHSYLFYCDVTHEKPRMCWGCCLINWFWFWFWFDAPRRDLAIAHIVFGPKSIFDLVRSGQRSNFREKWHFLALHADRSVSMCRSDLKPSPACSSFNSEQDRVFLLYPVAIFSIRSAPK